MNSALDSKLSKKYVCVIKKYNDQEQKHPKINQNECSLSSAIMLIESHSEFFNKPNTLTLLTFLTQSFIYT